MRKFFRVQLRTLDVERAKTFYTTLLGSEPHGIVPLHEQAIARGARPHWLGFIDAGDIDRATASFVERGAHVFARWTNPEGVEAAVVRDPGGAIVALARPSPSGPSVGTGTAPEVVFHSLNTAEVERAIALYGEVFGWVFDEPLAFGGHGTLHPFSWERGAARAGTFMDIAGRPGVHPHWLFHFAVPRLEASIDVVRRLGGLVLDPIEAPNGDRIAVCDDDQGTAFALHEMKARV